MSSSVYQGNSIFWIEIQKIRPNSFQPRKEFDEQALKELAESIRQYGILQPLVVTRKEEQKPNGGMSVYYELIAGERRLRAAKIAGLEQVPVIIRNDTDDNLRLELAIIENLQREDLNPIDRALAFEQLHKQFGLTHTEIGKRMGRSRVYVSNTLRILSLSEEIKLGLISGKINEGHTRPLLMLSERPEEQKKLYEEIILRKLSVRDAEKIARRIAQDKVRKKKFIVDPRIREYEKRLSENLGTRVHIEQKEKGGKILIDYFSMEDLEKILDSLKGEVSDSLHNGNFSTHTEENSATETDEGVILQKSTAKNNIDDDRGDAEERKENTFSEEILRFAESHGIELTPHHIEEEKGIDTTDSLQQDPSYRREVYQKEDVEELSPSPADGYRIHRETHSYEEDDYSNRGEGRTSGKDIPPADRDYQEDSPLGEKYSLERRIEYYPPQNELSRDRWGNSDERDPQIYVSNDRNTIYEVRDEDSYIPHIAQQKRTFEENFSQNLRGSGYDEQGNDDYQQQSYSSQNNYGSYFSREGDDEDTWNSSA